MADAKAAVADEADVEDEGAEGAPAGKKKFALPPMKFLIIGGGALFALLAAGGGGYYFLDTNRGQIDDEAGWYAVAGGDFGRTGSGLAFNAEVMYRNMEATIRDRANGTDIESKVPFDLSGLTVNAGLTWHF